MEQLEQKWRFKDTETYKVLVHKIRTGDVEDPDFLISWPLYEWQQTEVGKWVMKNSVSPPYWQREYSLYDHGHTYYIIAEFNHSDYTYYKLRYE